MSDDRYEQSEIAGARIQREDFMQRFTAEKAQQKEGDATCEQSTDLLADASTANQTGCAAPKGSTPAVAAERIALYATPSTLP